MMKFYYHLHHPYLVSCHDYYSGVVVAEWLNLKNVCPVHVGKMKVDVMSSGQSDLEG
jgi:hypothetical protein